MALDFGSLFGKKHAPLVGLDISTSGVKLVELAESGKNEFRLERYASEPLPRGAVVDGNIENIDQVSDAVRRVWQKSGTKAKLVALGIPPASVITKKNHSAWRPNGGRAGAAGRVRGKSVYSFRSG